MNFCVVAKGYTEDFELDEIATGGAHDSAFDGLAILVNEHIVSSSDDVDYFSDRLHRLDVQFVFIKAKTSDNFNAK